MAREASNVPSGLYFLGLLPPRRKKDHSHCSRAACVANQIDLDTYETQYTTECPGCDFLGVDPDEVSCVLCTGYIPVVTFAERGDQHSLKVHSGQQRPRYAAISHVWSDGLGNSSSNSLPLCELCRLANLFGQVDNLSHQVHEFGSHPLSPEMKMMWESCRPHYFTEAKMAEAEPAVDDRQVPCG